MSSFLTHEEALSSFLKQLFLFWSQSWLNLTTISSPGTQTGGRSDQESGGRGFEACPCQTESRRVAENVADEASEKRRAAQHLRRRRRRRQQLRGPEGQDSGAGNRNSGNKIGASSFRVGLRRAKGARKLRKGFESRSWGGPGTTESKSGDCRSHQRSVFFDGFVLMMTWNGPYSSLGWRLVDNLKPFSLLLYLRFISWVCFLTFL